MIRRMDTLLKLWAEDLHSESGAQGTACGNVIAMLIESRGELIRGTRGSRVLLDESADIELIVNKHLSAQLAQVVREHYCNQDSLLSQKITQCGCCRKTYYERLHDAQVCIMGLLLEERAA